MVLLLAAVKLLLLHTDTHCRLVAYELLTSFFFSLVLISISVLHVLLVTQKLSQVLILYKPVSLTQRDRFLRHPTQV